MTHQVALSREAYSELRKAKAEGESFSDVVLRLLREHQARQRDPWKFVRARRRKGMDLEAWLGEVEAAREADRLPREG